jgi:hypothetical protein
MSEIVIYFKPVTKRECGIEREIRAEQSTAFIVKLKYKMVVTIFSYLSTVYIVIRRETYLHFENETIVMS